ncbi:MAG: response regulator, partial [Synergistaceae bacterium]|nr:response regulator [Synergistaceae bacterium]
EGVGLGLAITRSIVKAVGGSISAVSEYGKGSTFTVKLPQKFSAPEKLASVENPEKKSVIIYERRKTYSASLFYTVKNLGVNCTVASSDAELYEKMAGHSYAFVFTSFALYANNKETISKFGANTKIVLLTEFGEAVSDKNLRALAMPAYCIPVANILNGVSSSFTYSEDHERVIRFTAPDANVLVVDDINTNLKVAAGLMQPYEMRLSLCKSGMEAIEAVKSKNYDLVFMDHKMPGMDGMETTQRIRAMGGEEPYYKRLPVIALTANAVSGTREMFLQNGFDDFLSKPVDIVSLNAVLEKWLPKEKQKKLEDE